MSKVDMKIKRMSLDEFYELFGDEEKCRLYFYNLKWPEGLVCPKCGSNHFYYIKGRDTYECADCGKQISLTAGTIMENTHLSYHTWLLAIYFLSNDIMSVKKLKDKLGISYKATRLLARKIKLAMYKREDIRKLSNEVEFDGFEVGANETNYKRKLNSCKTKANMAVETEELDSKIEKGYRRRKVKQVAIDITSGLSFDEDNRSAHKMIEIGSTLLVDNKITYKKMTDYKIVSEDSFRTFNPNHLKCLHIVISNFKSYIQGVYHGVAKPYMILAFSEYLWRINHRYCKDLVKKLTTQILNTPPTTCNNIVYAFKQDAQLRNLFEIGVTC